MVPKRNVRIALAVVLSLGLAACSTPEPPPTASTQASTAVADPAPGLDGVFADALSAAHAPQGVAAVSVPGAPEWVGTYSEPGVEEPVNDLARFPIRSVTKSFTVTLVLMLAGEGKVSMKDPISTYVDGVPNGDTVTLADLAAMRSGLPDYTTSPVVQKALGEDPERQWTSKELLDLAFEQDVSFEPGERYEYSNTNTLLLGQVVEIVTRQPLREAYESMIWRPLEMIQSSYPDSADIPEPHLTPYLVDGATGEREEAPTVNLSALGAAGGMVSTIHDLPAWATALGEGSLIGPRLQKQRLASFGPTEGGPLYDAYGWGIGQLDGWIGHTGEGIGYQAAVFFRPEDGATIVVLLNSSQEDNIATEAFRALAAAVPPPSV